jgi:hypothetical protein
MFNFAAEFPKGLSYANFLARHGTESQRHRWAAVYDHVQLTADQRNLLAGFVRHLKVACLAGPWCPECINQCPIFERFVEAAPKIEVRYFLRDAHEELRETLRICGGHRLPVVVFLSEDDQFLGLYGDRTLAEYRTLAGLPPDASCSAGLAPPEQSLLNAVIGEWLNQFERFQLMLRLSSRLRQLHGD